MEVPSIFLNKILSEAAKKNATALHLTVGNKPIMKINDQLIPVEAENFVTSDILTSIINGILSKEDLIKLNQEKELTIVKIFGGSFRFKINIFLEKNFYALSFYYIQPNLRTMEELKFSETIQPLLKNDHGLIIVAGSFGSGRTTTTAALLEEINITQTKTIITIEDPIEYIFISKKSIISQRQIGTDVLDFSSALDYCLDEDVDTIFISRIKNDFEIIIAKILELASGNALVVLEMDANSSMRVIQKIINNSTINMSSEALRYGLADVLLGVIVQKLVPSIGGGLVLAKEILIANAAVRSLIREGKLYQMESIIQTSRHEGMVSMNKSLEDLVNSGQIKKEDYLI